MDCRGKLTGMGTAIERRGWKTGAFLVAVGTACIVALFMVAPAGGPYKWWYVFPVMLAWFGGGGLIGAGAFIPFGRPWIGVIVGIVAQLLLLPMLSEPRP